MVQSQLMFIQLTQNSTNIQMSIRLHFRPLKFSLNSQSLLQKVKRCSHLPNPPIITSHIVKSHCLAKLVILTEFFGLFEEV